MKIVEEGLANYDEFRSHMEKDIQGIIEAMAKRTIYDGWCHLRLGEVKRLKGLLQWIQDYQKYSDEPYITKLNIEAIETAIDQSNSRKSNNDSVEVKALVPDKFVNDKYWDTFSKAMKAYLGEIIGTNGIPIVYIIRY